MQLYMKGGLSGLKPVRGGITQASVIVGNYGPAYLGDKMIKIFFLCIMM